MYCDLVAGIHSLFYKKKILFFFIPKHKKYRSLSQFEREKIIELNEHKRKLKNY